MGHAAPDVFVSSGDQSARSPGGHVLVTAAAGLLPPPAAIARIVHFKVHCVASTALSGKQMLVRRLTGLCRGRPGAPPFAGRRSRTKLDEEEGGAGLLGQLLGQLLSPLPGLR